MKKITILIILLINLSIFAQPELNISDINPLSISLNNFSASSTTILVGGAGANQTWNFSGLTLTPQGLQSTNSVLTAPFSNNFPAANFFINSVSNNSNNFGYYNLSNNKLEIIGGSSATGLTITYANPATIFVFPFTYNTVINDTYQTNFDTSPVISIRTYDAYGTLTTAFGTYSNVMRFKQVNSNDNSTNYTWIKLNPYQELLSASTNTANITINYNVKNNNVLATNPNILNDNFAIFPNPTNGEFTIKNIDFSNNETFVNVYDVLGNQIIKNEKIDSNSKILNISDFATGLYFIKIVDNNNSILYSDKIIKK
jgi:Secretion system C-terminal sorting domain